MSAFRKIHSESSRLAVEAVASIVLGVPFDRIRLPARGPGRIDRPKLEDRRGLAIDLMVIGFAGLILRASYEVGWWPKELRQLEGDDWKNGILEFLKTKIRQACEDQLKSPGIEEIESRSQADSLTRRILEIVGDNLESQEIEKICDCLCEAMTIREEYVFEEMVVDAAIHFAKSLTAFKVEEAMGFCERVLESSGESLTFERFEEAMGRLRET